ANQHEWYKRMKAHVPGSSKPPPEYPRSPTDYVNPPRQRGRLKTNPKRVSRARVKRLTHQVVRSRQSRIGRIGCAGYVGLEMLGE
ncbi:hypothetical protein J3R83DRAFT_3064, partial [Lanmaoa asiatica]